MSIRCPTGSAGDLSLRQSLTWPAHLGPKREVGGSYSLADLRLQCLPSCILSEFANDRFSSIEELASKAEVHPKIMRQALKLAFLAPDIVTSILAGGARFELADLRNVSALSWQSQRDELHQARSPLRSD